MEAENTARVFRSEAWLNAYGGLRDGRQALEYLALSDFWDAGCNNVALARQGLDPCNPAHLRQGACGADRFEYVVADEQPPHLFVIHKRARQAREATKVVAVYFVLDGSVYQAPTLHAVLTSRLSRCLHSTCAAFGELEAACKEAAAAAGARAPGSLAVDAVVAAALARQPAGS